MMRRPSILAAVLILLTAALLPASEGPRPKVRAITAFVLLDRAHYLAQVQAALHFLRQAKSVFEHAGYAVQTLRITTQPFPEYIRGLSRQEALEFFHAYDALASKEGFDASIGPAMRSDADDPAQADLLGKIIASTSVLEGSIVVADEPNGVHWHSVRAAAELMKSLAETTAHSQGNFRFAATALVPENTPFYPASYHESADKKFSIGLQGANLVTEAFASAHGDPNQAAKSFNALLQENARAVQDLSIAVEKQAGWTYLGLDDSPAPLKDVSIGAAIEELTGAPFGSSGTLAAVALLTGVLKEVPGPRVGYSGLLLPVLEDSVLARRWGEGRLRLDDLLVYSAVCGTGLDVVPLPGDITEAQLAKIIGDVATLAVRLHKPLSARLLPVAGKKAGERTEFDDPFLVNTTIQPLP